MEWVLWLGECDLFCQTCICFSLDLKIGSCRSKYNLNQGGGWFTGHMFSRINVLQNRNSHWNGSPYWVSGRIDENLELDLCVIIVVQYCILNCVLPPIPLRHLFDNERRGRSSSLSNRRCNSNRRCCGGGRNRVYTAHGVCKTLYQIRLSSRVR